MNGFRIWTPADNGLYLHHSKRRASPGAKHALIHGLTHSPEERPSSRLRRPAGRSAPACEPATVATAGRRSGPLSRRFPLGGERYIVLLAVLILSMAGCGKRTPTYSGPPDTVRQIVMKKWAIIPERLEVPQGARVELVVSTTDVEHGLAVPGLGIREPVQPGKPAVIRFLAQTPGVYPMRCSVLCGRGHDRMKGVIIITGNTGASSVHK